MPQNTTRRLKSESGSDIKGKNGKWLRVKIEKRSRKVSKVNSKNYTGALAAACGRDETGLVGLVLWDADVKKVCVGDIIRIENGWCRLRDGEIVVSTGRSGTLTIIDR